MEKYNKKRKRLSEMSSRHLRRLVQNEINSLKHNDEERLSESILPNTSKSAQMSCVHESEKHKEIIQNQIENDNVNIFHESNERRNNAVHLINLNINNVNEIRNIKSLLCDWAVTNNVNHVALAALLKILRTHECFSNLPVDPRTLLHTPKYTKNKIVLPGSYSHFGIRAALEKYYKKYSHRFDNENTINLGINIDGLLLSKSSTSSLWPILGCVLPYKEIFIIGAYYGSKKPTNCNEFLYDFVEEMKELINNKIFLREKFYTIKIKQIVCDAPAKSFILNIKSHSGYFSCTKCKIEGEYRNRRICFPDINVAKRTNNEFLNETDENFHLGSTNLKQIPQLDFIENIPLDYMHLLCLGIMRKCLYLWTTGDLKIRLQHQKCQTLSNNLKTIKHFIPDEFCRKPRSLDYLKQWKATEYRQILLYTGPVVFQKILPNELYHHFLTLHVAIRIVCCKNLCEDYLNYAEELLIHYVKSFKILYGEYNVSYNVHNLIHLCDDVRVHGTLDSFSTFRYENFLQEIKKIIRKADKPLQQLHRRYVEKNIATCNEVLAYEENSKIQLLKEHSNGPLIHNCTNPQYKTISILQYVMKVDDNANNCCFIKNKSIIKIEIIAYCNIRKCLVAIGKKFMIKADLFQVPCLSSLLDIYVVSNLSELCIWPISDITKKMLIMPYSSNTFVVIPLLHIE